MLDFVEF